MLVSIGRLLVRHRPRVGRRFATSTELIHQGHENETDDLVVGPDDYYDRVRRDDLKSLKIAILGLPNAGKSTLVNQLARRPICAASSKVHTTRVNSRAVFSHENTQLIFIDTPGVVSNREMKKHHLEDSFKRDARDSLKQADIVGVIQDASNIWTREKINDTIIELLEEMKPGTTSLLILNKVDKMKSKRRLLDLVKVLTGEEGWPDFSDLFMVSALSGDGVDDLRNYLLDSAKRRDWDYQNDNFTDQPPEIMIERAVRARLLDSMPNELPYQLQVGTEHFSFREDGSISSVVEVRCPSDRISKLVMGKHGQRVKSIAIDSEQELSSAFQKTVRLKIAVIFQNEMK